MCAEPDLNAALGVLEVGERETVRGFAYTLGLDDWTDCPPLRRLVVMTAALRLSADQHPNLSATGQLREALYALGGGRDSCKIAHSISRQLRRWQSAVPPRS